MARLLRLAFQVVLANFMSVGGLVGCGQACQEGWIRDASRMVMLIANGLDAETSDPLLHPRRPLRDLTDVRVVLDDFSDVLLRTHGVDMSALQRQIESGLSKLGLRIAPEHPLDSPTPQLHIYVGCFGSRGGEATDTIVDLREPVSLVRSTKMPFQATVWQHRSITYVDSCTAAVLQGRVLWAADLFTREYKLANDLR